MTQDRLPSLAQELRIMNRLSRLFRVERCGRFRRWPVGLVLALVRRRGRCIETLIQLDAERRHRGAPADVELRHAARALAQEVSNSLPPAETRADRLRSDVKALRGEGETSGMKGFSTGKVLGRG